MPFKDILVYVDNSKQCPARLETAANLAAAQGGHLIGLHVRTAPEVPQFVMAQYGPELHDLQQRYAAESAAEAERMFTEAARAAGVPFEWRSVDGDLLETVALHGRYADITIVGQSDPDAADTPQERRLADHLVLSAGRPVLVVPYVGRYPTVGKTILCAWNASREATRAVNDALPLMIASDRTHVLSVDPKSGPKGHGDVPGADICLHLARHGVPAACEYIRGEDMDIGNMLLSRAADDNADLLVMGAYGRSRLREVVLGGATRHILQHMTLPVLMSH